MNKKKDAGEDLKTDIAWLNTVREGAGGPVGAVHILSSWDLPPEGLLSFVYPGNPQRPRSPVYFLPLMSASLQSLASYRICVFYFEIQGDTYISVSVTDEELPFT